MKSIEYFRANNKPLDSIRGVFSIIQILGFYFSQVDSSEKFKVVFSETLLHLKTMRDDIQNLRKIKKEGINSADQIQ